MGIKWKNIKKAMKLERQGNKRSLKVYIILRALVIAVMIRQCFLGNFENVFMCGLTLILMLIPSFVQVTFRIELPTALEIIILMFIFSAEILGEVNEFYINSRLGHSSAYAERISCSGNRLFSGQPSQQ